MKNCVKIPLLILAGLCGAIAVLFTVYIFNLDMKFIAKFVDPILQKHYSKMSRKQYV